MLETFYGEQAAIFGARSTDQTVSKTRERSDLEKTKSCNGENGFVLVMEFSSVRFSEWFMSLLEPLASTFFRTCCALSERGFQTEARSTYPKCSRTDREGREIFFVPLKRFSLFGLAPWSFPRLKRSVVSAIFISGLFHSQIVSKAESQSDRI